jgi:hypothetical protein
MKSCQKCSREFIDQFKYCPIDGTELTSQKESEEREESNSRNEIEKEEYDF